MIDGDKVITNKQHYDGLFKKIANLERELEKYTFRVHIDSYTHHYMNLEYEIGNNLPDKVQIILLDIEKRLKEEIREVNNLHNRIKEERRKIEEDSLRFNMYKIKTWRRIDKLPDWIKWCYNIKIEE